MIAQHTKNVDLLVDAVHGLVVVLGGSNHLQCIALLWLVPAPAEVDCGELACSKVVCIIHLVLRIEGVITVDNVGWAGDGVSHGSRFGDNAIPYESNQRSLSK